MAQPTSVAEDQSSEPEAPVFDFPLGWLLDNASPSIQARACLEVAGINPATEPGLSHLPYSDPEALRLAVTQSLDGTWNASMLSIPPEGSKQFEGVGTIPATRRLIEYGWERESPPLMLARRILFRLLSEDNDPYYLFELGGKGINQTAAIRFRSILREAASGALAQAGYEADPRLRGSGRRILERMDTFLDSPLAEKPWVRIGNRHVLAEDAAPPSIYTLTMLAYMPIFRSEHYPEMERLYAYLTQPKPTQESVQLYGKEIISQPHLIMGDPLHNRNVVDSDVPFALLWLETMARFNFLKRNENWLKMYERLVDDRDRYGVWHPRKGSAAPVSTNPYVWSSFPIGGEGEPDGPHRWTDVTFRLGLIAKQLGWRIKLV
jgi:hypothetical protein